MIFSSVVNSYKELFAPLKIFYESFLSALQKAEKMNHAGKVIVLPFQIAGYAFIMLFAFIQVILVSPFWLPLSYIFDKLYRLNIGRRISDLYDKMFFKG